MKRFLLILVYAIIFAASLILFMYSIRDGEIVSGYFLIGLVGLTASLTLIFYLVREVLRERKDRKISELEREINQIQNNPFDFYVQGIDSDGILSYHMKGYPFSYHWWVAENLAGEWLVLEQVTAVEYFPHAVGTLDVVVADNRQDAIDSAVAMATKKAEKRADEEIHGREVELKRLQR